MCVTTITIIIAITNNYATGSVTGSSYVGGLVGYAYTEMSGTLTLTNNYATGDVSGQTDVGGLVGYVWPEYVSK